jgi:hypothetical protein
MFMCSTLHCTFRRAGRGHVLWLDLDGVVRLPLEPGAGVAKVALGDENVWQQPSL